VVSPGDTVIGVLTVPEFDSTVTMCLPADSVEMVSGVTPRSLPSSVTRAFGAVEVTRAWPVLRPLLQVTRCQVWTPAEISTGSTRVFAP
jgi:hypothetical protein